MKIIGFTYQQEEKELIMKGDSALLVNQKPFFIPDYTQRMAGFPALALRVCKLGKNIGEKFAMRYIDAAAPAFDLQAMDMREAASKKGRSWTTAVAMDGSFPVGEFIETSSISSLELKHNGNVVAELSGIDIPAKAIAEISRYISIRQGDIIFIPLVREQIELEAEDQLTGTTNNKDTFFCRIK